MPFYRDILQLKYLKKVDIPANDGVEKDYGHMLQLTEEGKLFIGNHDSIKGQATSPENIRLMHNLFTDEVKKWTKAVEKAGCKILQSPIKTPFYSKDEPVYVSTWLDPDGNCWQFMGKLPE